MATKAIKIDHKRCKSCGICAAYCKQNVISYVFGQHPETENLDKCTGCKLCELICPDFAIKVEVK